MRKALADQIGVEVPPVDEEMCNWDLKSTFTPEKKDGKIVVVGEERNETEEIPRGNRERGLMMMNVVKMKKKMMMVTMTLMRKKVQQVSNDLLKTMLKTIIDMINKSSRRATKGQE